MGGSAMRRLLLDTNIYGLMAADPLLTKLKELHTNKKNDIIIYGFPLIRRELRATPKTKLYQGRNLRVTLLSIYDEFVGRHTLNVKENVLAVIAEKYYNVYKELGGSKPKTEMFNDYLVVACASKFGMDIMVSNDDASMLSEISLKTYTVVNQVLKLKNPEFMDYEELVNLLSR